jgi:hypothetical protein
MDEEPSCPNMEDGDGGLDAGEAGVRQTGKGGQGKELGRRPGKDLGGSKEDYLAAASKKAEQRRCLRSSFTRGGI